MLPCFSALALIHCYAALSHSECFQHLASHLASSISFGGGGMCGRGFAFEKSCPKNPQISLTFDTFLHVWKRREHVFLPFMLGCCHCMKWQLHFGSIMSADICQNRSYAYLVDTVPVLRCTSRSLTLQHANKPLTHFCNSDLVVYHRNCLFTMALKYRPNGICRFNYMNCIDLCKYPQVLNMLGSTDHTHNMHDKKSLAVYMD